MGDYIIEELSNARALRPGSDDPIYRWKHCPKCEGRGWVNRRPFADYNHDPVQCPTCETEYMKHINAAPESAGD